jgi:DNA modification methylase
VSKKSRFNLPGIGPTKEKILIDAGYETIEDLEKADFYDLYHLPGFGYVTTCSMFLLLRRSQVYPGMIEVFDTKSEDVLIENKSIKPWVTYKKSDEVAAQPEDFKTERTTVWSFPDRGDWASHTPQYRGNWSPRVIRNIIELYSKPGDTVLDPMVGGGTTPVECLLMGRNSISSDINPGAISITRDRLNLPEKITKDLPKTKHRTYTGDVRNLNLIQDGSIDLLATHPPYANMIRYAPAADGDLSQINDYELFFKEFSKAIKEFHRVLKPGAYCAILIGDTHNRSHYVPISYRMMIDFLRAGFVLKEDIIKKEWNCESDRYLAKYSGANFLLTMHEHLYIFRKPESSTGYYKNSSIDFFGGL